MEPQQQPWAAPPSAPAGKQPWAGNETFASRLPIGHPWAASRAAYAAPLLYLPGRIRGKVSPYREGWLCMAPEGMVLSGKAVAVPWLAENSLRPRLDALTWDGVEEVVINSRQGRMCVVYHLPDAPDKPLSLGLQLAPPPLLQQFAQVAAHYLGADKVHEGKIGPPTPPVQIAIVLGLVLAVVFGVIALVMLGVIK